MDFPTRVAELPVPQCVSEEMNRNLTTEVTAAEIRRAVLSIGVTEAPGSDGFTEHFYRTYWDIAGMEVVEAVQSFFRSGRLLKSFNHTWLTLVLKVDVVESMKQIRPISLCQLFYKIISKIMTERMAIILPPLSHRSRMGLFVAARL
ncbi:unnamed protein product [Linum trigynum]|uniref:Reverse transcriptase n=1 Tax=Linum trigynum TaxID=586398 RepID=A0AAV2FSF9_9ROSI